MKTGKVSQTTWRRTVSGYMDTSGGMISPAIEECCADYRILKGMESQQVQSEWIITSQASCVGDAAMTPVFAMAEAINALAAKGASAKGILLSFDLPVWMEEKEFENILMEAARAGKEQMLPISNIQVQTIPSLTHMLVHATVIGYMEEMRPSGVPGEFRNADIVAAGCVGLAGSLQILSEKERELGRYFQQAFLNSLKQHKCEIFAADMIGRAYRAEAGIWQAGAGGILAALWNMGETLGVGMELDIKKFPILQETIEVCEQYDVNPYLLTSAGTMIFVLQGGERLAEELRREGYRVAVIGHTIRRNERVLRNGEDIRYLDRPAADEIWKILSQL